MGIQQFIRSFAFSEKKDLETTLKMLERIRFATGEPQGKAIVEALKRYEKEVCVGAKAKV